MSSQGGRFSFPGVSAYSVRAARATLTALDSPEPPLPAPARQ